jgi:hypothetical protein
MQAFVKLVKYNKIKFVCLLFFYRMPQPKKFENATERHRVWVENNREHVCEIDHKRKCNEWANMSRTSKEKRVKKAEGENVQTPS